MKQEYSGTVGWVGVAGGPRGPIVVMAVPPGHRLAVDAADVVECLARRYGMLDNWDQVSGWLRTAGNQDKVDWDITWESETTPDGDTVLTLRDLRIRAIDRQARERMAAMAKRN